MRGEQVSDQTASSFGTEKVEKCDFFSPTSGRLHF